MFNLFKRSGSRGAILITSRQARLKSGKPQNRTVPTPIIQDYPVTLRLKYPTWDLPLINSFDSAQQIEDFLGSKQFLVDTKTNHAIRRHQIYKIDPKVTYEVAGSGLPFRSEGGMTREQMWDKVLEEKTAAALKDAQEKEGGFVELPRVVKDPVTGLDTAEWESILKDNDGIIIFLGTKYRMSKVS
jgi:hypothetical protein